MDSKKPIKPLDWNIPVYYESLIYKKADGYWTESQSVCMLYISSTLEMCSFTDRRMYYNKTLLVLLLCMY